MKKILLIDDCDEFREMVSDLLDASGYQVMSACSPENARTQCGSQSFDLILCDLVMPVEGDSVEEEASAPSAMVGVHTIRELSNLYPKVPVVAISGELVGAPLQLMQQFGAVEVLSKPFGRDELLKVVERVSAAH